MHCQVCKADKRTYKILLTGNRMIIYAEWVPRFFGTTHLVAKADRMHTNWTGPQPEQVVAIDDMKLFVHERWLDRDESADFRFGTWELFRDGMEWEAHPQCDRHRSRIKQVMNLIIEQGDMFNG
jgi:hypothetical protein